MAIGNPVFDGLMVVSISFKKVFLFDQCIIKAVCAIYIINHMGEEECCILCDFVSHFLGECYTSPKDNADILHLCLLQGWQPSFVVVVGWAMQVCF